MFTRFIVLGLLCCTLSAESAVLIPQNATWRFLRGTNEASLPDTTAWRQTNFNDSGFADAPAPFWYGDFRAGGTQLTTMSNNFTCIFLRRAFVLTNAAEIGAVQLTYFIDDGFVAWINGVEIFREGVFADPVDRTTLAANQPIDPAPTVSTNLFPTSGYLRNGTNWMTVQVFNTSLGSSDIGFDCSIVTLTSETNPPTIVSVSPLPGNVNNLTQITVTFSEPVLGVDAGDMLLNTQPANSISGSGTTFTFGFNQPLYGNVSITWFGTHGITDDSIFRNPFNGTGPGATWNYTLVDSVPPTITRLFPSAGATVLSLGQVEVTFSEEVTGVNAADLLINSDPATNVTRLSGGPYTFQFSPMPAGAVQLQWAGGHGITDQAENPNPFAGGSWSYTVDPNAPPPDLIINEVLASNQRGLLDEDGQEQDWIEIFNRGSGSVDLAGWSLSDDPDIPSFWIFPSHILAPGEYLVLFASGKDRQNPTGTNRFHTNFQLTGGGEFLGLYSADSPRRLVSAFDPYPEQRNDNSYGYDSGGNLRYFATPTPGGSNGVSTVVGVCEPVHFSTSRGYYSLAFDLGLTSATPGAAIRYTLDGSEPSPTSTLYSAPLRIANTTLLRASAFKNNFLPSRPESHSYFFNQSAAIRSLPVVSIVTSSSNLFGRNGIMGMNGGSRGPDGAFITNNAATDYHNPSQHGIAWERPVSVEYIRSEDNSGFQLDAGIRVQGSDWQRPRTVPTSKFSFRLYFRGDYGPGRLEYPLFPLGTVESFDQLVLRAGFNEQANPFIRDEITRRMSHDMGQVSAHGAMFNLFTNGIYAGFYNPCERVHEEMLQSQLGGGSEWDVVGPDFAVSSEGLGIIDGDRNQFNNLMNYVWVQQNSTTIMNPAIYNEVARRLDLENFVDYCLINAYTAMGDWPANNWRAARERVPNGIWRFIVWDAEWAMGIYELSVTRDSFALNNTGTETAGLNSTVNSEIARLYQRLRVSPEFRLLWADRIQKHFFNGGALTGSSISNRFNELRVELAGVIPTMDTEILTWARDRGAIVMGQFNTYGLYGLSNSVYGTFASSNAPAFNQHGGRVAPGFTLNMTAPLGGTIFYTTNGEDPRVKFTGVPSPTAVAYTSSVTLNQTGLIKARTRLNGTNWSAVSEATFDVGTRGIPLRITEINYNPVGGSIYEFIEFQNVGGAPLDLDGIHFESGVNFTFVEETTLAAGARLVIANNADANAFAIRYPGVNVTGYFSGNLDNAGERLTLSDSQGRIILTVDYDDDEGWPAGADGNGFSLELIDVFGSPDDPANWTRSSTNGSPGQALTPPSLPLVRLNEIMAENLGSIANGSTFPDWIEIHNAGTGAVDLANWSLSDAGNALRYVFPLDTMIGAGGYLVVWCDSATNTTPGLHTGFSLDEDGDSVFLYDTGSNRVDAVGLGLQLPNFSVGRIGGVWQLNHPTPNATNLTTAVGSAASLSINEWMANPVAGQPDWLELYNASALPVPLRGNYLATTTSVQQLTTLSFIGGNGFVQLFADEEVGAAHLDFKLTAAGGAIILYDTIGGEVTRVTYTAATEGVSRGRLPDGSPTLANFPGSASPGASNFVNSYTGAVLNEVLARNQSAVTNAGRVADYLELYNPNATSFTLEGMSLSVGEIQPLQWSFPVGASLPGNSYLVIWCDGDRAPSVTPGDYNTGRSLEGDSGGAYLFNNAGQVVNSVEYGFQVPDQPIGFIAGQWRLFGAATPGATNGVVAALGGAGSLRINEWMADSATGSDWFELHNLTNRPVDLAGLFLSDDASTAGQTNSRLSALSFIAPRGFVKLVADADLSAGRNHVNFSLDGSGELLRIYSGGTVLDSIGFGAQLVGVSQGRLLDGADNIVSFDGSPTPGESNHLPLGNALINEILTHADSPLEDAIELHNPTAQPVNIGGWFLSNGQDNFRKYRIPDGTTLGASGFAVFYQAQFGNNGTNSFTLNSSRGGEVWLSAADGPGNLTGSRTSARFGPARNGISFGRIVTPMGVEYAALSARTFGADTPPTVAQFRTGTGLPNATPLIGPIVLNEVMYHPAGAAEEYVELQNISGSTVTLYDPVFPTNRWRLSGGVEFLFPPNVSLTNGQYALVVGFDPAITSSLNAFRTRYGISPSIPVFGPYVGQLDNAGETLELLRPDAPQTPGNPDAGFVPYVVADKLAFTDQLPWPTGGVDGGGLSLQRRQVTSYGNDPLNWLASAPTPGAASGAGVVPPPTVTQGPQSQIVTEDSSPQFSIATTGQGPLTYQWRVNGINIPGATAASLAVPYVRLENGGQYDVIVANSGGSALSTKAALTVIVPISVINVLPTFYLRPGSNVVFNITARGTPPLAYQWRHNGTNIPGATSTSLSVTNIQLDDDGQYEILITNPFETYSAAGQIGVLVDPVIVIAPIPFQTVPLGGTVTVGVEITGNPGPFRYEWRRGSVTNYVDISHSRRSYYTVTNETSTVAGGATYRLVVQNPALMTLSVNRTFRVQAVADTDGDGIPDSAEASYGGATNNAADALVDLDGDGFSNREEFIAGTDPTNETSYLRIDHTIVPGTASLQFFAVSNRTYSVQYQNNAGVGNWLKAGDALAQTNNRPAVIVDPTWTSNRFYRVVTPAQP